MLADIPAHRLKVFAAGLHELGARCDSLGGALGSEGAPSLPTASSWQANATAVNVACAGSHKDLAGMTTRMQTSGTKYAEAGTSYTANDDDSAARLGGLAL